MNRILAILLVTVLVVALVATAVSAQSPSASAAIKINPLGLIIGAVSGEYESVMSSRSSMVLQGLYWSATVSDVRLSAIGGGVGLRIYLRGSAPEGFYVGGGGTFASVSGTASTGESASASLFGVSGTAGFQWVGSTGLVFDIGASLSLPLMSSFSSGDISESDVSGALGTGLYLSAGYGW